MTIATKRVRRNREITATEVRLIDAEGEQAGILKLEDAMAKAEESGLDLVEVSPNAEPPVCRIMDFGKYLFEQKKKAQAGKTKTKQVQVKEIKFPRVIVIALLHKFYNFCGDSIRLKGKRKRNVPRTFRPKRISVFMIKIPYSSHRFFVSL